MLGGLLAAALAAGLVKFCFELIREPDAYDKAESLRLSARYRLPPVPVRVSLRDTCILKRTPMNKPARPAVQLRAMVQVRLNAQPEVQRRVATDPHSVPVVGQVVGHERDALGRNWNIAQVEQCEGLERTFRSIVDGLRDSLDLT
jgi:hypothetical protein